MDKEQFVDALNADLRSEYRSIVQYTQHAAVIKGAEHLATIEELRRHLSQELSHAQILAEQVDFLGGVPTVEVQAATAATEARAALEALETILC